MSKQTTMKVYAARDKNTGKFVSDLTSHRKKFWERKNACIDAVNRYNSHSYRFRNYDLEVVELLFATAESSIVDDRNTERK